MLLLLLALEAFADRVSVPGTVIHHSPRRIQTAGFGEYFSYDEQQLHPLSREGRGNVYWRTPTLWKNGRQVETDDRHTEERFCSFIIDFMKPNKDSPFMAFYSMNLCHRPFEPTPVNNGMEDGIALNLFIKFKEHLHYFPDIVEYVDTIVVRLLATLEKLRLHDTPYVFFTADNGTDNVWDAMKLCSEFHGRQVEGGKYKVSDLGGSVPFIANMTRTIIKGRVSDEVIDFTDALPTLLELAGRSVADGMPTDGQSFLPLLKGQDYVLRQSVYSWGGFIKTLQRFKVPKQYAGEYIHVLRSKRWKYYSDVWIFDMQADTFAEHPELPGQGQEADESCTFLA